MRITKCDRTKASMRSWGPNSEKHVLEQLDEIYLRNKTLHAVLSWSSLTQMRMSFSHRSVDIPYLHIETHKVTYTYSHFYIRRYMIPAARHIKGVQKVCL